MKPQFAAWFLIPAIVSFLSTTAASLELQDYELMAIVEEARPSIVCITVYDGKLNPVSTATGFFVNEQGDVITNWHVVQDAVDTSVLTADGELYAVRRVAAVDREGDLALLSVDIPRQKVSHLSLSPDPPVWGDTVTLHTMSLSSERSILRGIVSAFTDVPAFGEVIGTTARVYPGWSGSPVINRNGKVVGVVSCGYSGAHDLTIVVPGSRVAELLSKEGWSPARCETNRWTRRPVTSEDFFVAGLVLRWLKHWTIEALFYFERALERNPRHLQACLQMAYCYNELGHYDAAVQTYKQATRIEPGLLKTYHNLGAVYEHLNQFDEAMECYKEAIRIDPDASSAYYDLGRICWKVKLYDQAIEACREVLRIEPHNADGHYLLALIYYDLESYGEAMESFREAIRIDPGDADAHCGLGLVYRKLERYGEAIGAYVEAIRADPGSERPHYLLGDVYDEMGRYPEATQSYRDAVRINPENAVNHCILGLRHLMVSDVWSALGEYQILKDFHSDLADTLFVLLCE